LTHFGPIFLPLSIITVFNCHIDIILIILEIVINKRWGKDMKKIGSVIAVFSGIMAILLFIMGCSSFTGAILGGVESGVSRAAEERVEQALYSRLAPKEQTPPPKTSNWNQFMVTQAQIVFSYSFSAGGLWVGSVGYVPGEWTKFAWEPEGETPVIMEKAFLKKLDNGNEWWRVSWYDKDVEWIYEALISPTEEKLLRLRAKDADGNEGEIPVTADTPAIYNAPAELTEDSIEGATVGKETITTPAGTFSTDHIKYLAMAGEGEIEWWATREVPGGIVKYLFRDKEEGVIWTSILNEKGRGATTILGSY
jgi:hypothetical protein